MKRPSLLRFVPLNGFEFVVRTPANVVRERLEASVGSPPARGNDSAPLSGTLDGNSFELRLRDSTANSGRAFLVGEIQDRGASTAAIGHVCVGSLPVLLFLAMVGLAIALGGGAGAAVALWGLAILAFGHAKTRLRTLRALQDLMSDRR